MTILEIPTGQVTKAGFPSHSHIDDTKLLLHPGTGDVFVFSGAPVHHGLRPANPEELAALEALHGDAWRDAVAAARAL